MHTLRSYNNKPQKEISMKELIRVEGLSKSFKLSKKLQ